MMSVNSANKPVPPINEKLLILILAAVQFTHIMDFVIIMPLGPQLMRVFSIDTQQFGLLVSSYTFSAGLFGFMGAFYLDKLDRKSALLWLYSGFTIGTLLCAIAPTFGFLLTARILTGAFGGVLGATVFSIIGDVIPYERRGTATGMIMSAFSVASVIGVPTGLFMASHFGWHSTFFLLALTSALVLIVGIFYLPAMKNHMGQVPVHKNMFKALIPVLTNPNHVKAFALMSAMMFAGFSVIPFISPYMVFNAGMTESQLPLIYLAGGTFTFFSSPWVGRLSDKFGKQRIFLIAAVASLIPVMAITVLPPIPLPVILVIVVLFFITVNGRIVPAMAMITGASEPRFRGSFMAINSSVQQLSSGVASLIAGMIIGTTATGALTNYWIVGLFAVATTLVAIVISKKIITPGTQSNK
ncbi:MAG: MFS transporter [Bacteroidetes bacterium]|nr:MFS transporter [Bacteroidota bacterium]